MDIAKLKNITINEALAIFNSKQPHWVRPSYFDWTADAHGTERCVYYHDGDLHCSELDFNWGQSLVVDGDLYVDGNVSTHDDSELIVLGSMHCQNFLTYCSAAISGDLTIDQFLLSDSQCDLSTDVGGALKAHFIFNNANTLRAQAIDVPLIYNQYVIHTYDGYNNKKVQGNVTAATLKKLFSKAITIDDFANGLAHYLEQGKNPLHANAVALNKTLLNVIQSNNGVVKRRSSKAAITHEPGTTATAYLY